MTQGGVDASSRDLVSAPHNPRPDRRFEIVDEKGVARAVFGLLEDSVPPRSAVYGLSLRGADGAERVALSVDDHGPTLVFVRGGNIALQLGVDEPVVPGDHAGAFITVAGSDGVPLLYVSAEADGSLQIRTAAAPPP